MKKDRDMEQDTVARERVNSFFNENLVIYNPLKLPVKINEKLEEYELEDLPYRQDADFDSTVRQLISVINEGVTGKYTPCRVNITFGMEETEEMPPLYAVENTIFIPRKSVSASNREYYFEDFHFTEAEKVYNSIGISLDWKYTIAHRDFPDMFRITLTTYFTFIELVQYYGESVNDMMDVPFIIYSPENGDQP